MRERVDSLRNMQQLTSTLSGSISNALLKKLTESSNMLIPHNIAPTLTSALTLLESIFNILLNIFSASSKRFLAAYA